MPDIEATYGFVEIAMSRDLAKISGIKKKDRKGWFVWPSDLNSLEALMAGVIEGPFETEEKAASFAMSHCFEKTS